MINRFYVIILLILLALPSLAFAAGCGTSPTGVVACYPVNIVNNQVTATTSGFQIKFNSLPFNALQGNYLVYNGLGGATLSTWIESNSIMWTNLGANTIAGSASANGIYYIGIGSAGANFFLAGNNVGEAPQLSASYGQYDNGNAVFSNYWNFAGTSVPSGLLTHTSSGTVTVNNGITIKGGTSATGGSQDFYTSSAVTLPTAFDFYGTLSTSSVSDSWGWTMVGLTSSPTLNTFESSGNFLLSNFEAATGSSCNSIYTNGAGSGCSSSTLGGNRWFGNVIVTANYIPAYGTYNVFSQSFTSSGYLSYVNYANTTANSIFGSVTSPNAVPSTMQWGIAAGNNEATYAPNGAFVYWARQRTYPPNGIIPTVTYGTKGSSATTSTSTTSTSTTSTSTTILVSISPASNSVATVGDYESFNGVLTGASAIPPINVINMASVIAQIGSADMHSDALNPFGNQLWVTNEGLNTVSVYSVPSYSLLATINVGSLPKGITIIPNGTQAWVGNSGGTTVSIINTATYAVTSLSMGASSAPREILFSPDGTMAYVLDGGTNLLAQVNVTTHTITNTINVGPVPKEEIFVGDSNTIWVTDNGGGKISVVSLTSNSVTSTITTSSANPHGLTLTPNGAFIYETDNINSAIDLINVATKTVTNTIHPGGGTNGALITNDGSTLYAEGSGSLYDIVRINTSTNTVTALYPQTLVDGEDPVQNPSGTVMYFPAAGTAVMAANSLSYSMTLNVVNSITKGTVVYSVTAPVYTPAWSFNGIQTTYGWYTNSPLVANAIMTWGSETENSIYSSSFNINAGTSTTTTSTSTISTVVTTTQPMYTTSWTVSTPTIFYNQYLSLQANVTGGQPPYNFDFLLYNAAGTLVSNTLYQAVYPVANSLSYLQIPDWGSGSFKANILVTDSAIIPNSATNSLTYSVNANTLYIVANAPTANYPRQIIGSNVFVENGGTEITSNVLTSLVGTISIAGIPLPQGLFASLIPINSPNIYVYTTFSNTVITTSNMTAFTTANGYASKINTHPTYIVPSSPSYQQLNIYLLPNSIASSYSMTVYSCGVLAYGDYLYVYRGASPIRGNLTDIINLQQIPFALSMDSSYPYGFQLVASNGTTIYTSAFQIWNPGLSITLQAPCAGVPVFKLPTSAASCNLAYNSLYTANMVTCTGSDPTDMVNQWNVTIYNSSGFLGLHQIASNVFNSNTFSWSYYPIAYPNPVTVKVLAYWDGGGQAWTFNLQNIMASSYNTPLNTFIVILFLLVGVAAGSMTGGSHKLSNTMFIEAFIIFFLYMAGLTSWLQAPLNGGVIIFLIVIGIFGQMKESSIMTG